MGRRTGRGAGVWLLAAIVLLSIFAGHSPNPRGPGLPDDSAALGPASLTLHPDVLATRAQASPSDPDASAVPEYPSSVVPQPLGRPGGPHILLDNAITAHRFDDAWALGYRGQNVRAAVVDEGVDFGHLDLHGTQALVTDPASPYYGWPIAYDPKSLTAYLKTGFPDGTLFSNTSRTGTGPFEVTHTIKVDGTNDFGDREKWALDPRDNTASGPGGDKADFDLTDLYATRDATNWYFGFPVYLRSMNASFTLLIDLDNETSGAYVAPRNTVDTNTSASDRVNDVRWSPDGTRIAAVSGDRFVRIWDPAGRILHTMGPHAGEPVSVAWSPDGTRVASADKDHIKLWDASTGAEVRDIQYVAFLENSITDNRVLAFNPNGTWIAASTYKYVHFYNVNTGASVGTMWAINGDINGVGFSPLAGDRVALALGNNQVRVYAITPTNLNPAAPATALYTLSGHTQPVLEVAWSPDETQMVSTAKDNTAILWNLTTQTPVRTLTNQSSWILSASWNAAGTRFVTGSRGLSPSINPSFAIWDNQGNLIRLVNQTKPVPGVDWSSLGSLATGSEDLTARVWTGAGDPVRILVAHRPEFALYVHGFSRYSDREGKYVHGTELATWYAWNTTSSRWDSVPLLNASGKQSALQFGEALFNEFSVPRSLLGDPAAISIGLFSSGENVTRAQDTVPSDRNVDFKGADFSAGWSHLSAWAWRRIEEYRIQGLTSASGVFHFGFHAAPAVQRTFGALGLLVVDSTTPGLYDKVYLDMNDDHVFDAADVVVTKANPIATVDAYDASRNPTPDGYPDISAGMMYFLANGVHAIPYSDRITQRKSADGLKIRVPGAGDLVAFAGEFGVDPITATPSEHGTRIASEIVAQGRLPTPIVGTAGGARLMAIMNGLSDPIEAWTFAVEGYDGRPGTSDDAQVVLSAFNYPTLHADGWDVYSRTADFLSSQVSPTATFVASAGDYGWGYGTVSAPASGPTVIAAGRAADYSLRSFLVGGVEGPNPHDHDPAIAGSRGPTAAGFAKPELLAVDTTTVDIPLHSASDGTSAFSSGPMTGSDVSAGIVAGAVAIVVGAFNATHARLPSVQEVRAILMSSADDAGGDVLTQGAGFLNMSRAVRLAAATSDSGLLVTPSAWHPGGYRGASYAGLSNLVYPGDSTSVPVVLRNQGTASIAASLEAVSYTKVGEYAHANATRKDLYSPYGDVTLWVNDTGLWKVDGATLTPVRLSSPVAGLWANADLVKVTAYSDLSRLVTKITTNYQVNYSYALRAYDWSPFISAFPWPASLMGELNTVAEAAQVSNVLEVRVASPARQLRNALVISLEDVGTPTYIDELPWTFVIEFYQRTPWPWITLSETSTTVFAGAAHTVDATLAVPGNAPLGQYEAAIRVIDVTHGTNTTIPVLVNVAASGPNLSFGGNLLSSDLFDTNRLFGGYDRALATATRLQRPYAGDWRFYFFEIPDQGLYGNPSGYKILVQTGWPAKPSDVDTFAFGRTSGDAASQSNASFYGAFTLKQALKGDDLDKPDFKTATNDSQEFAAYDLQSGVNVIALHAFSLRGGETDVRITGRAGWINAPSSLDIVTPNRAGRAPFGFLSNMNLPGLRASAVGPAQTTAFSDIEVPQDVQSWWNFAAWGEWMFRATFNYTFRVEKALILDVHIEGQSDVNDLDMAVFRNVAGAPCEWDPILKDPLTGLDGYWKTCVVDPEEYLVVDCTPSGGGLCVPAGPSTWGYNADGDSDEAVKWVNPPDGEYTIKVLGFTVPSRTGHFDMQVSVTLDTGKGYAIPEAPKPAEIVNGTAGGLAPFTRVDMNMTWDFPAAQAEASYGGAILLGLPNAPGVVVVPASVTLDQTPPQITSFKIQSFNARIDRATNLTTNDRRPIVVVGVADPILGQLVPTSVKVWIDGLDVTSFASVSVQYLVRANKLGLWEGTVSLVTPPLADGTHTVNASIADRAGNVGYGTFAFAVDTGAPTLVLAGPLRQFTGSDTFAVSGQTDPGAQVNVRGSWRATNPGGSFSYTVPLLNGTNALPVTAADWFDADASGNPVPGNPVTITQTVIRDLVLPAFDRFVVDPSGTIQDAQTVVSGNVHDMVSDIEPGSVQDLSLTVNGNAVPILADGSFRAVVALTEGSNAIRAVLTDGAGNQATADGAATRDTTKPALTLTPTPPEAVQTPQVTIAGTTEPGAYVTVNGVFILSPGGRFSTNVTLSPGPNTIVVQSRDIAGNVAEVPIHVVYSVQSGGSSLLLPIGMGIVGVMLGILLALLLVRGGVRVPGLSRPGPARARSEEEGGAEAAEEESVPAEPTPQTEDPRIGRLRKALDDGRISQEVYDENLRRIHGGS